VIVVASVAECAEAISSLAELLAKVDPAIRAKTVADRTVSCTVKDLQVIFVGQLRDGGLHDIQQSDTAKAQVRVTLSSDDLILLTRGELDIAAAWARGRVKVDASVFDLLKLRSLI
jgi:predicted lipid carrier protein YhbT